MAVAIKMPQLGLTMEEGTVENWLAAEGDEVKAGQPILEITTDKLTNEVEAETDGVLLKIEAQPGEDVKVQGILGWIGKAGEELPGAVKADSDLSGAPAKPPAAAEAEAPAAAGPARTVRGKIRISPLARKMAGEFGIDYSKLTGTGPSGRILKRDILKAKAEAEARAEAEAEKPAPKAEPAAPAQEAAAAPVTAFPVKNLPLMEGDMKEKLKGMRRVIAERMHQSTYEIPRVTQVIKVDVTDLFAFRRRVNDEMADQGVKFSVNDFIMKAVAKELRRHPEILVSLDGDQVIRRAHVNLGMAVALDGGLITPVIRDADRLSIEAIAKQTKELSDKARNNGLAPDDYKGSTFTVSNLGMYGIESFTPVINQPEAGILGVGAAEEELRLTEEGKVEKHLVMRLSFTYDHRLIDGATAAIFEADLKNILEHPLNILL